MITALATAGCPLENFSFYDVLQCSRSVIQASVDCLKDPKGLRGYLDDAARLGYDEAIYIMVESGCDVYGIYHHQTPLDSLLSKPWSASAPIWRRRLKVGWIWTHPYT